MSNIESFGPHITGGQKTKRAVYSIFLIIPPQSPYWTIMSSIKRVRHRTSDVQLCVHLMRRIKIRSSFKQLAKQRQTCIRLGVTRQLRFLEKKNILATPYLPRSKAHSLGYKLTRSTYKSLNRLLKQIGRSKYNLIGDS